MKNGKSSHLTLSSLIVIGILILGHLTAGNRELDTDTKKSQSPTESYNKVMAVLTHTRCMNCHPSGDVPRQGEDAHLHYFDVERGPEGQGLTGYTCNTCHQKENNNYSGVPGAPHWGLAPSSMAWEGKSETEIATQILDPERNGGKNLKEIEKHLTEDELVLWAWEPGVNAEGVLREIPPVSKQEFIVAVKEWIAAGAPIPSGQN